MLKVLKNLRKSSLSVIAIIVLLCIQAWADLELPNYTSKIVNIGIQSRWYRKCSTSYYQKISNGKCITIYKRR